MRERAAAVGGTLTHRDHPDGGFEVVARHPVQGADVTAAPIRVMIADDQEIVRAGFSALLDTRDDITVVGTARDGRDAIEVARANRPDVVLMDVRMPNLNGIEATRVITTTLDPAPRVIVLTTFDLDEYVYDALSAGASGFLLKDVTAETLFEAVRVVARGDALLTPNVTRRLIDEFVRIRPRVHADRVSGLTAREIDVLRLIAAGRSNAEIGAELFVSSETVKTHVSRILAKLDARDRTQAVIAAYESGICPPERMTMNARILFTCRPLSGHFDPLLPLAAAARASGHEVAFASGDPVVGRARDAGFTAFEAGPADTFRAEWAPRFPGFTTLVGDAQRTFFFTEIFANLELAPRAVDLDSIMSAWQPDLVVHEMAELAAPLVSTARGIPYVDVGYGSLIPRALLEAGGCRCRPALASPRTRTRSARRSVPIPLRRPVSSGTAEPGDRRHRRRAAMRPAAGEAQVTERPAWLDDLPHRPTVYVTLGTIWNTDLDVFRLVIEALRDHVNLIVTVGRAKRPGDARAAAEGCDHPQLHPPARTPAVV